MQGLSPRLEAVLDFCRSLHMPCVLADIGTDHAYLPIVAIRQNVCESAIACDLHPGPLDIARANILDAGLCAKIQVRLGDGLQPLSPGEADCIVIAGMGGMRISNIILEGMEQARAARQLILQPQHDVVLMRKNLHETGFEIQGERLARETVGGKEYFYVVIAARSAAEISPWTEREYFLGKFLIEAGGDDFSAFKWRERQKIAAFAPQVRDNAALDVISQRLSWLAD